MWEYMSCKRKHYDIDKLLADCEALGDKGWELVNVTYVADRVDGGEINDGIYMAVLKRRKSS